MRPLLFLCLATACTASVAQSTRRDDRAAAQAAKVDRALAGLMPGPAQGCLNGPDRRFARVTTYGSTMLFRIGRDRVFRNDMNGNCTTGTFDPIVVTQTPSTALCRGDIAQLIDRASRFPVGSCSYGDFIPYTRAK